MGTTDLPAKALFHESLAWNLFEDALEARFVESPGPTSIWGMTRVRGLEEGWLNPNLRQAAREMFVFCDKLILPRKGATATRDADGYFPATVEAGTEIKQLSGHLSWAQDDDERFGFWERAWNTSVVSQPDLVRQLWPFIRSAPGVLPHGFTDSQLDRLLGLYWDPGHLASASPDIHLLHRLLEPEFGFLVESLMLAQDSIPSIGIAPRPELFQRSSAPPDVAVAVGMYFKNVVRCPSPRTLDEAIQLKTDERIIGWRKKVLEWSQLVASGKADWSVVEREIEEANGYLEGANWLSRLVPAWSIYVTLPLDVIAYLEPTLIPYPWISLGVSAVQAYGGLAEKGAKDSRRYPWLISRG